MNFFLTCMIFFMNKNMLGILHGVNCMIWYFILFRNTLNFANHFVDIWFFINSKLLSVYFVEFFLLEMMTSYHLKYNQKSSMLKKNLKKLN